MPNITAHISVIKSIYYKNNLNKKKINLEYLCYGAMFPDFYYFVPIKSKLILGKNLSNFWHDDNDNGKTGINFSKHLISFAKTKEELSFAYGFLSHFILDKYVHTYLRKHNCLKTIEHLVIEHFLDLNYKTKIPTLKYPKQLFKKVFKEKYPLNYYQFKLQLDINHYKKWLYKMYNLILRWIVRKKYKNEKNTQKIMFWDLALRLGYAQPLKKNGFKHIKKLIYPDYNLKKEHIPNLKIEIEKAKKEIVKEFLSFKI